LGLAICRGLLEAMGGRIWVETAPGGGAAFVVRLPSADPPADPPKAQPAGGPRHASTDGAKA
jgi:K+-sensing histidine kinase KdpD